MKNPNILLTKALALRDSGQAEEALQIFEQFSDNDAIDIKARAIGNRARCLLQLSRYPEEEELLRESLALLNEEQSYNAKTNLGYAFLWLAEVFFKQGKVNDAKTNILLAREVWLEYAPGHLSQLKELESFLDDTDKEINPISKSS